MEEIILKEVNGQYVATSRQVAEKFEKEHKHVMRDIRNIIDNLGCVQNWTNPFSEVEYINEQNKQSYKEYEMNRDGFSLLAMGFTGQNALEWKYKYINAFNKMEEHIKQQNVRALPTTYKEALLQLIHQLDDNEKLLVEVDKYERFLCEKTGMLTKTQLATKLDTKPQTLASKLKKAKVYTPTSQVSSDFLKKYPDTKLIVECDNTYLVNGIEHTKPDFQWSFTGSKIVVDYLISLGMVTFTENNGFKLAM